MKKIFKNLCLLLIVCAVCAVTLALSACYTTQVYTGEYSYESWGTNYGIKVGVTVQSDNKGDRIRKVEILPSDYVEASPEGSGAGEWQDRKLWDNGIQSLLLSYRGRYIADIMAVEVGMSSYNPEQPESVNDESIVIAGATLGSGRLALAVQSALKDAAENLGYKFYEGEYGYVSWGTNYGIKVSVAVKDGTVMGVNVLSSDYVDATAGWDGIKNWQDNLGGLLENYRNVSVEEITAIKVPCAENGEPLSTENGGLSEERYLITGATLGSGRLLLAVQNALSGI